MRRPHSSPPDRTPTRAVSSGHSDSNPYRRRGHGPEAVAPRPRAARLLGHGRARHQARPARDLERDRALGGIGFLTQRELDRGRSASSPRRSRSTSSTSLPSRGLVPAQVPRPGHRLPVGFQLIPIVYNASVAFSNWSTGHNLTKEEAIQTIEETSLAQPPNGGLLHDDARPREDGTLVLLLVDQASGKTFVGTEDGLEPLPAGGRHRRERRRSPQAKGYDVLTGDGARRASTRSSPALVVPAGGNSFVRAEGLSTALELKPTLALRPEGRHVHEHRDRRRLLGQRQGVVRDRRPARSSSQGWRTNIGLANFKEIFTDPLDPRPVHVDASSGRSATPSSPSSSRSSRGSSSRSR